MVGLREQLNVTPTANFVVSDARPTIACGFEPSVCEIRAPYLTMVVKPPAVHLARFDDAFVICDTNRQVSNTGG
jgi:hypothetical protein